MTNYEKIKAMSIDEMAEFLDIPACHYCVAKEICKEKTSCYLYIKRWLESEE